MSSLFIEQIKPARPTRAEAAQRRFVYVPYDRQTCEVGPLAQADPRTCGVVLIESSWKASRRPYHKQKLALLLANQRHFALELAARGYKVIYQASDRSYGETLRALAGREGIPSFTTTHPAERELRRSRGGARGRPLARAAPTRPGSPRKLIQRRLSEWPSLSDGALLQDGAAADRDIDGEGKAAGREVFARRGEPEALARRPSAARAPELSARRHHRGGPGAGRAALSASLRLAGRLQPPDHRGAGGDGL